MNQRKSKTPATKKESRPRREQHGRFAYEAIRTFDTIKETDDNRDGLRAMFDALALWARYMMEVDPTASAGILRAVLDAWRDNRNDERERKGSARDEQMRDFHINFYNLFHDALSLPNFSSKGDANKRNDAHRAAILKAMAARVGVDIQIRAEQDLRQREKQTSKLGKGWDRAESFGLHQGDTIEYVEAEPHELRRGDFIAIYDTESKLWDATGYFESADALGVDVLCTDGSYEYSRQASFKFYLILSANHAETFERPKKGEQVAILNGQMAGKLGQLKKRLDNLGDDITDSTERLKIERQIYDLEQQTTTDEWPEIVND